MNNVISNIRSNIKIDHFGSSSLAAYICISLMLMLFHCPSQESSGGSGSEGQSSAAEISSFRFEAQLNEGLTGDIDCTIDGSSIYCYLPLSADISSLIPTVDFSGVELFPGVGSATDFTNPVEFRVAGENSGETVYQVYVSLAGITGLDLYYVEGETVTIHETENSITIFVPAGTDVTSLYPDIEHSGQSIFPENGSQQDFTGAVTYEITLPNGEVISYLISVVVLLDDSKAITAFEIDSPSVTGTIDEDNKTISVSVPFGTDVSNLTPAILHSGLDISPASGLSQDFSMPVVYFVTAADSSIQEYTVTVSIVAGSSDATLASLSVTGETLDQSFSPARTTYTMTVTFDTSSIEIIATPNDPNATVSGDTGTQVLNALGAGDTVFNLTVTAEDTITTQDVEITVERDSVYVGDYTVATQQDLTDIAGFTSITGSMTIESTTITDVDELTSLASIGGNLQIINSPNLENIDGLGSLESISGNLLIIQNNTSPLFTNVDGFSALTYFGSGSGRWIQFSGNTNIVDLNGLANINNTTEIGSLHIQNENSLLSLSGLDWIESISSSSTIYNSGITTIGLTNLSYARNLDIRDNASLMNLDDLDSLTTIGYTLTIANNDGLSSLSGLSNLQTFATSLYIQNNDGLTSLGMTSLTGTGNTFYVTDNTMLPTSLVNSLYGQLTPAPGNTTISGNL